MKKTLLMTLVLVMGLTVSAVTGAASDTLINMDQGHTYTSDDLHRIAKSLVEENPDLLEYEKLGYSRDQKPIYVLVMTENVQEMRERDDFHVARPHFYIDGGNHSREDVNPVLVMKMIEDYISAYRNDESIGGFSLRQKLSENIFHFLPVINPDGFDLARFGSGSIQTEDGRDALSQVHHRDYGNFKSSLSGVDHNRNFPYEVYKPDEGKWMDLWEKNPSRLHSSYPSKEFYAGPYPGSEPAVRLVMEYSTAYDFRNFATFHSRGQLTYWHKYYWSDSHNEKAKRLALAIQNKNGYRIGPVRQNGNGGGYFSTFVSAETQKPSLTIETLPAGVRLPTEPHRYRTAYENTKAIPLIFAQEGNRIGYHPYRLYVNDIYVRDYEEKVYAEAEAKRSGGTVIWDKGVPAPYLERNVTYLDLYHHIQLQSINEESLQKIASELEAFKNTDTPVHQWHAFSMLAPYLDDDDQDLTYASRRQSLLWRQLTQENQKTRYLSTSQLRSIL